MLQIILVGQKNEGLTSLEKHGINLPLFVSRNDKFDYCIFNCDETRANLATLQEWFIEERNEKRFPGKIIYYNAI